MDVRIDNVRYYPEYEVDARAKAQYAAGYADGQASTRPEDPLPEEPKAPSRDMAAFFSAVRKTLFHGTLNQAQVDGIELLVKVADRAGLSKPLEQLAYILGTVYHETARTMEPIEEIGGSKRHYAPWYGRGFVQLTWEANYQTQQNKLQALVPEFPGLEWRVHDDWSLAMHPLTSAVICVFGMRDGDFTGKALGDYINSRGIDYVGARRVVNGTDRAQTIAQYAFQFEAALKAGGFA